MTKTVSLETAWDYIEDIIPTSANYFEALNNDSALDEERLQKYTYIRGTILKVENRVGISTLIDKLNVLEIKSSFYDPSTRYFFPEATKDDIEYATVRYSDIKAKIVEITAKIDDLRDRISIEIDI